MGNRPLEEKRDGRKESESGDRGPCYRNSILRVQSGLAEWDEWNEDSIRKRGNRIIDFALECWRIGSSR